MSSADVQLRLMKWWDGGNGCRKRWPTANLQGRLRLHAGELTLVDITHVGSAETQDDQTICRVQFKVRWDVPQDLQNSASEGDRQYPLPERIGTWPERDIAAHSPSENGTGKSFPLNRPGV